MRMWDVMRFFENFAVLIPLRPPQNDPFFSILRVPPTFSYIIIVISTFRIVPALKKIQKNGVKWPFSAVFIHLCTRPSLSVCQLKPIYLQTLRRQCPEFSELRLDFLEQNSLVDPTCVSSKLCVSVCFGVQRLFYRKKSN